MSECLCVATCMECVAYRRIIKRLSPTGQGEFDLNSWMELVGRARGIVLQTESVIHGRMTLHTANGVGYARRGAPLQSPSSVSVGRVAQNARPTGSINRLKGTPH